jgi:hypothetical protein
MKNSEATHITTVHPLKGTGVTMHKSMYDSIVDFIVQSIQTSENVNLSMLLAKSQSYFPKIQNITWFTYQVKLDLEARGLIRIVSLKHVNPLSIQLTTTGIKSFGKKINA